MGSCSSGNNVGGEVVLRCVVTLLCACSLMLVVRDRQAILELVGLSSVVSQLRYSDSTGLVYLVYANGLAALYCIVVAFTSFFNSTTSTKSGAWVVFLLDQVLTYILLSATSAATEIQYLVEKGNKKTIWDSKCTTFGHFCHILEISITVAYVAVILLAIICVFSVKKLFHHYSRVVINKNHMLAFQP